MEQFINTEAIIIELLLAVSEVFERLSTEVDALLAADSLVTLTANGAPRNEREEMVGD